MYVVFILVYPIRIASFSYYLQFLKIIPAFIAFITLDK